MESISILEKQLRPLGLTANEVRLYTYLLYKGGSMISEISKKMGISSTNTYPITESLMKKGLVESMFTRPVKFYAIALDKALDILIMQQQARLSNMINTMQEIKKDTINKYQSLRLDEKEEKVGVEKFQVLREGLVTSKLLTSLKNVHKTLYLFLSKQRFIDLDKTEFMSKLMDSSKKNEFQAKFLLDERLKNLNIETREVKFININDMNDFILVDDRELFYYLDSKKTTMENSVLWTNLQSMTKIFHNMFEQQWKTVQSEQPPEIIRSQKHQNFIAMKKDIIKLFSFLGFKHEKDFITGISGIPHNFDMLLQTGTEIIGIDFIFSQSPVTIMQILSFYVKIYDLKGLLSKPILILSHEPNDDTKRFIEDRKITCSTLLVE